MLTPQQLEQCFTQFSHDLHKYAPDGIISVDLNFLHDLGLLDQGKLYQLPSGDELMHHFHVIETDEKVTLFNEHFVVWIVPQLIQQVPTTLTFIGRLVPNIEPHLELIFSTTGVYNTPKFILKVVEQLLMDVVDTEALILSINRPKH